MKKLCISTSVVIFTVIIFSTHFSLALGRSGGGGGWGEPGPRRGGSFVNLHKLGRVKPVLFPAGGRSQFFLARKNLLHVAQLTLIC